MIEGQGPPERRESGEEGDLTGAEHGEGGSRPRDMAWWDTTLREVAAELDRQIEGVGQAYEEMKARSPKTTVLTPGEEKARAGEYIFADPTFCVSGRKPRPRRPPGGSGCRAAA